MCRQSYMSFADDVLHHFHELFGVFECFDFYHTFDCIICRAYNSIQGKSYFFIKKDFSFEDNFFGRGFDDRTIRIFFEYIIYICSIEIFFSFFFATIKEVVHTIFAEIIFFCKGMSYF